MGCPFTARHHAGTRADMAAWPFALARLARQALPQRSDFVVLSLLARSISIPTRIMSAKEWSGVQYLPDGKETDFDPGGQ